ncbi:hypothetical protein HNY73_021063 [Argiope bruennichi]|uniref:Uncharacterized protein n=1 Tax=Argiope bruennichi TaxID=94029 RepID=A0A8T0ECR6_ARGBR|nr:hypothetical protein HNY73_021063 [Argiope bruennichi]
MLRLFLIIGVLLSARTSGEECTLHHLQSCLESLQSVTKGKDLALVTTRQELLHVCKTLKESVVCVDEHMRNCFTSTQRQVFNQVVAGARQFLLELCVPGSIQEAYLEHSPCYRNVSLSEDRCAPFYRHLVKVSQKVDEKRDVDHRLRESCCAFNEFVLCKYIHVNQDCGQEAAIFLQRHLDRISSPLLQEHCAHYTYAAGSCSSSGSPTCSPSFHFLLKNAIVPMVTPWITMIKVLQQFARDLVSETIREKTFLYFFL